MWLKYILVEPLYKEYFYIWEINLFTFLLFIISRDSRRRAYLMHKTKTVRTYVCWTEQAIFRNDSLESLK